MCPTATAALILEFFFTQVLGTGPGSGLCALPACRPAHQTFHIYHLIGGRKFYAGLVEIELTPMTGLVEIELTPISHNVVLR